MKKPFLLLALFLFPALILSGTACDQAANPVNSGINFSGGISASVNPTGTPTGTPATPHPTPSTTACFSKGYQDPSFAITPVPLVTNDYVSNGYNVGALGVTMTVQNLNVYVTNASSSSSGILEMELFNQGFSLELIADSLVSVMVNYNGWLSSGLAAGTTVVNPGVMVLLAHAKSGSLSIGSNAYTCGDINGNYPLSPVPIPFSAGFTSGACYEMNFQWCR